jgi:hypothetical protein
LTRQDPVKTRLQTCWFLFFLLKWSRFDLKKKLFRWPCQNLESGSWTGRVLKPCKEVYLVIFVF